jgi:flagellar motor switch/type III secretory pathway protein FliN
MDWQWLPEVDARSVRLHATWAQRVRPCEEDLSASLATLLRASCTVGFRATRSALAALGDDTSLCFWLDAIDATTPRESVVAIAAPDTWVRLLMLALGRTAPDWVTTGHVWSPRAVGAFAALTLAFARTLLVKTGGPELRVIRHGTAADVLASWSASIGQAHASPPRPPGAQPPIAPAVSPLVPAEVARTWFDLELAGQRHTISVAHLVTPMLQHLRRLKPSRASKLASAKAPESGEAPSNRLLVPAVVCWKSEPVSSIELASLRIGDVFLPAPNQAHTLDDGASQRPIAGRALFDALCNLSLRFCAGSHGRGYTANVALTPVLPAASEQGSAAESIRALKIIGKPMIDASLTTLSNTLAPPASSATVSDSASEASSEDDAELNAELNPGRNADPALLQYDAGDTIATPEGDPLMSESQTSAIEEVLLTTPVDVAVELGRIELPASAWLSLREGDVLETNLRVGAPVQLTTSSARGVRVLAEGELVRVGDQIGVRILHVVPESIALSKQTTPRANQPRPNQPQHPTTARPGEVAPRTEDLPSTKLPPR